MQLEVRRDGRLEVSERITVFFEAPRHGIYRDIPVRYNVRQGFAHDLRLGIDAVLDGDGNVLKYQVSRKGREVRVRIGDPGRTLQGERTYVIRYHADRGIDFYPDHDELYWNITGNEWAVPIAAASARVHLPDSAGAAPSQVTYRVFTGAYGSAAGDAEASYAGGWLEAHTRATLGAWEGMTLAVGWPKGLVSQPGAAARAWELVRWNWPMFLPLPVGVWVWRRWRRLGRDPAVARSVAVQYEPPPGLTPSEMGTLLDERADVRDITAAVVDLAVRGWLRIEAHDSKVLGLFDRHDVTLVRLAAPQGAPALKPHESQLLSGLFERGERVRLDDLRQRFYVHLPPLRRALYEQLVQGGVFSASPDAVRQRYLALGFVVLVGGGILAAMWVKSQGLVSGVAYVPPLAGVVLSALVLFVAAPAMPRRTRRGVELLLWARGLQEFITRVESPRLEIEQKTGLDPRALFERVLPYAMVLGVASRWAGAFQEIYTSPPTWYVGPMGGSFSSMRFVNGLERMNGALASNMVAAPRSSTSGGSGLGGGGFSGGGHGGGGGGAW